MTLEEERKVAREAIEKFLSKPENLARFKDKERMRKGLEEFLDKNIIYLEKQKTRRIWENRIRESKIKEQEEQSE